MIGNIEIYLYSAPIGFVFLARVPQVEISSYISLKARLAAKNQMINLKRLSGFLGGIQRALITKNPVRKLLTITMKIAHNPPNLLWLM